MSDMTEAEFAALQAAVTLARNNQYSSATALRDALVAKGFTTDEANRAIAFWGQHEREKKSRADASMAEKTEGT